MSFRTRLALFFALIVVLPIAAIAVLVVQLARDSATGKVDARIDASLDVAEFVYAEQLREAQRAAREIAERLAEDRQLIEAVERRDPAAVKARARSLGLLADPDTAFVGLEDAAGETILARGSRSPIATARVELRGETGPAGAVIASTARPRAYAREVRALTGEDVALASPSAVAVATPRARGADVPGPGEATDVEIGGEELRGGARALPGRDNLRVGLFTGAPAESFLSSSPAVLAAALAFFAVAFMAILVLTRTLQGQIAAMLGAARRIGEGDFSRELPVVGHDEMAGLAQEFNKMSARLAGQMDELRRQRVEIDRSVRRIGQAFASGLDRHAMLAVLAETAVAACASEYGLIVLSGHVGDEAEAGEPTEELREAALAAEHRADRGGGLVELEVDGIHALASSLGEVPTGRSLGVVTLARSGRAWSAEERNVFLYLLGQAAASVENVALHELVSQQAVTDELTGLANNRAFRETMDREAARAARFGHDLSLLLLDIDDFKQVNDTYGHLQGDAVLLAIGRILRAESREIDAPARYGGEEFVVALPETDRQGALELGERIRERIASEPIPLVEGEGEIRVSASVGTATMPGSDPDVRSLIAAADAALYEAKRSGKNRVVEARLDGVPAAEAPGGRRDDVANGEDGNGPRRG